MEKWVSLWIQTIIYRTSQFNPTDYSADYKVQCLFTHQAYQFVIQNKAISTRVIISNVLAYLWKIDNTPSIIIYQFLRSLTGSDFSLNKSGCEPVGVRKSKAMEVESNLVNIKKDRNRKFEPHDERDNDEEVEAAVNNGTQNPKLLSSIYNYLVVLSIILIIFAAFRNSVTWWV